MQQPISLKPQDIAILVKLLVSKAETLQTQLAQELSLSQGEIAKALARLNKAGLVNNRRVNRSAALEFILHAIKYIFPAEVGALAGGGEGHGAGAASRGPPVPAAFSAGAPLPRPRRATARL